MVAGAYIPMVRIPTTNRLIFAAFCLSFGAGCSGDQGSGVNSDAVSQAGTTSSGANGSGATTGSGADRNGGASSGGGSAATGNGGSLVINISGSDTGGSQSQAGDGTPEICDGEDNDSNGIIDDVDAGHDGVCDCLNIATIGHIGPWSNGGDIFASWLNARSPIGAVALEDAELTAESLKKFQVIVVLHAGTQEIKQNGSTPAHHAFSDGETGAFDAWLRSGGGVMTTIGYTDNEAKEVENVNLLLAKVGMGYSTSKLDLSGNVKEWMPHPVTDGITNIFTNNGVEPDVLGGTTLARNGDKVALQVTEVDDGRVAVWGDEWITYDSEWSDVKGQQVEHFWLNLLKWLSPPHQCQVPIPTEVK